MPTSGKAENATEQYEWDGLPELRKLLRQGTPPALLAFAFDDKGAMLSNEVEIKLAPPVDPMGSKTIRDKVEWLAADERTRVVTLIVNQSDS